MLSQLDREFPELRPSAILAGQGGTVDRDSFAHLYGRTAALLAAMIRQEDQGGADDYESRTEFMVTVLLSSHSLREAINAMTRFNAMLADHGIATTADPDSSQVEIDIFRSLPGAPPSLQTVSIVFVVNMLSWLAGSRVAIEEVGVPAEVGEALDPCLAELGVPIRPGQVPAYIRFAPGTLDQAVSANARRDPEALYMLWHDPLYYPEIEASMAAQVSHAFSLLAQETGRCPDRLAVCHQTGVSASTLHRHLQAEGTSFQQEKSRWQKETALDMLGRGEPPKAIAWKLGFQDVRSFRRAFVSWTGNLPSAFVAR